MKKNSTHYRTVLLALGLLLGMAAGLKADNAPSARVILTSNDPDLTMTIAPQAPKAGETVTLTLGDLTDKTAVVTASAAAPDGDAVEVSGAAPRYTFTMPQDGSRVYVNVTTTPDEGKFSAEIWVPGNLDGWKTSVVRTPNGVVTIEVLISDNAYRIPTDFVATDEEGTFLASGGFLNPSEFLYQSTFTMLRKMPIYIIIDNKNKEARRIGGVDRYNEMSQLVAEGFDGLDIIDNGLGYTYLDSLMRLNNTPILVVGPETLLDPHNKVIKADDAQIKEVFVLGKSGPVPAYIENYINGTIRSAKSTIVPGSPADTKTFQNATPTNSVFEFELSLEMKSDGSPLRLTEPAVVCLPYTDGMDKNSHIKVVRIIDDDYNIKELSVLNLEDGFAFAVTEMGSFVLGFSDKEWTIPTANEEIEPIVPPTDAPTIRTATGTVSIDSPRPVEIRLYTATGALRYVAKGQTSCRIFAPKGFYILKVNDRTYKIIL